MTVSICIPTYNSAKYLRECIESVLAQTFTDFDLIVCDNGSTDDTGEIVRSFSDPRVQFHSVEPFVGLAGNFNHAAGQARGKYVKLLCHDDLIEPTCLEKQVAMIERNPSLALVTCGMRCVDASGKKLGEISWCSRETTLREVDVIAANLVYGNVIGIPSATLIRRENLVKAGPFSESFPQMLDVEMYLRLLQQGPAGYLPDRLCVWRLHAQAATETNRRTGVVRRDMRIMTDAMLRSVLATWWARRIAWGRVAGSFLSQALSGLRHGYLRWPRANLGRGRLAGQWDPTQLSRMEQLPGKCTIIRREVIENVGLLDEGYDFWYEDVDFCHRALKASWELWCVLEARIHHYGGASSGLLDVATGSLLRFRNMMRYARDLPP